MTVFSAAVLTVSDSAAASERADLSGPAVRKLLEKKSFHVIKAETVPDDQAVISDTLIRLCEEVRLVVTTGGTGLAARDVTPEATRAIADRLVEGIAEQMRTHGARATPMAILSRAVCAVRRTSLILNLPGSPKGATESLSYVIDVLPHALELLGGNTQHASTTETQVGKGH